MIPNRSSRTDSGGSSPTAQCRHGSGKPSADDWGPIWFEKLAQFHRVQQPAIWDFDEQHVIDFLRARLRSGAPAWKRLRIVEGLISYRNRVRKSSTPRLEPIRQKLQEIAIRERFRDDAQAIEEVAGMIDPNEPDVIGQLRRTMRLQRKQHNTEKAYVKWVRRFMRERCLKAAADFSAIGPTDVEAFLTDLAVDGNVSPSTQDQAFYALLFLFEHVLKRDLGSVNAIRSGKPKRIPSVLSEPEVTALLGHLSGVHLLIAQLLYGCGLRIGECLRLRVKDIRFDLMRIEIHDSKGGKSRLVPLPAQTVEPLRRLLKSRRVLHEKDLERGEASVWLPHALSRKFPSAHREFKWQFLFASAKYARDPRSGKSHRHHLHWSTFAEHLRLAVRAAGTQTHVNAHTFRHSFATHLLAAGTDIRTIQELMGHSDIATTMIYTHVLSRKDIKVVSPLDRLNSGHGPASRHIAERSTETDFCTPSPSPSGSGSPSPSTSPSGSGSGSGSPIPIPIQASGDESVRSVAARSHPTSSLNVGSLADKACQPGGIGELTRDNHEPPTAGAGRDRGGLRLAVKRLIAGAMGSFRKFRSRPATASDGLTPGIGMMR